MILNSALGESRGKITTMQIWRFIKKWQPRIWSNSWTTPWVKWTCWRKTGFCSETLSFPLSKRHPKRTLKSRKNICTIQSSSRETTQILSWGQDWTRSMSWKEKRLRGGSSLWKSIQSIWTSISPKRSYRCTILINHKIKITFKEKNHRAICRPRCLSIRKLKTPHLQRSFGSIRVITLIGSRLLIRLGLMNSSNNIWTVRNLNLNRNQTNLILEAPLLSQWPIFKILSSKSMNQILMIG